MSYEQKTYIPVSSGVLTIDGVGWDGKPVMFVVNLVSELGTIVVTEFQDDVFVYGDSSPIKILPGRKTFRLDLEGSIFPFPDGMNYQLIQKSEQDG